MVVQFTIVPLGEGVSISRHVTKLAEVVDKSGLDYRLTAMGTIVEGGWDEVMALVKKCHGVMARHSERVITTVVIDDRKGAKGRLQGKVDSVLAKTKRRIRT